MAAVTVEMPKPGMKRAFVKLMPLLTTLPIKFPKAPKSSTSKKECFYCTFTSICSKKPKTKKDFRNSTAPNSLSITPNCPMNAMK